MTQKKIKWTDQQHRAITARDSDVLVTASAGTGKTAVLSGRCVDIISDKSICPDVSSILVLTFTEAAAEEMRSRIAQQLKDAYVRKNDRHLYQQLILLQGADISTIHSFCKRLITEYFYTLDLDPTFSVIDGDEQKLLKTETLEKTIDLEWQQNDIRQALEELLYQRDLRTNDGFLSRVIEISDLLDGVVHREDWYERAVRLAEAKDLMASELGKKQKQMIAKKLRDIINRLRHAQQLAQKEGAKIDWVEKLQKSHIEPVIKCMELLEEGDWDKFVSGIRDFEKPRTYKPKDVSDTIAELVRNSLKKAVDSFGELSPFATVNPEYLDRLGGSVRLQTNVLVHLVRQFDRLYSQAKRTLNCLDFADLEHYALRLLANGISENGELSPSQTALTLRGKYKHIFVDEYQDINSVQQQILLMLSSGDNVLQVGDVKQSIYAFRGAEPDIFLERLKIISEDSNNLMLGLRVDLNANFRSVEGVLDFVNQIFSRIMTESFSKIDYDESAWLKPAIVRDKKTNGHNIVEFHILDESDAGEEIHENEETESNLENLNTVSARRRQAAMIAQRIRKMVGADSGKPEFQIFDTQTDSYRDVDYRDIVVLMRSLAQKANDYVEVFRLAGVPVSCQATAGYFQTTEINDCVALLKVLDNPQQDIELAAVLRSPFFKITDTELAKIKIYGKKNGNFGDFYSCVVRYCNDNSDEVLAARIKEILTQIENWRTKARRASLADLIWQIYRETNYLSFVAALPNGQARRANLLKLHDRAIQFEDFASSSGIASLTRFVEFIKKLQETGQDWAPAEPQSSAGNAVRILSVHKSKGLEFPVVFLAGLESKFNLRDVQSDCLADANDTIGLRIIDRDSNSKVSSLAHQVIAEQKLSTAMAEEMRILYVATTRARDRLILTASCKKNDSGRIISNGIFFSDEPVPDWQLRACHSPLEWILYALSNQKILHRVFETDLEDKAHDNNLFDVKLYGLAELIQLSDFIINLKKSKSATVHRPEKKSQKRPESKLLTEIKKSLAWQYQYGEAPYLSAKTSVTELTHRNDEFFKYDYSGVLDRQPRAIMTEGLEEARPIEPRLIGTASHLVISSLDLSRPITKDTIDRVIENLIAEDALAASVVEQIDIDSILTFFDSDLGRIAIDSKNKVLREWPFTYALPISEYDNTLHASPSLWDKFTLHENIIVQGIIDMLIATPEGLVVIDFKTDKVTEENAAERAENYRRQLELYGRAASAILKSKVIHKYLYFLNPRASIEV